MWITSAVGQDPHGRMPDESTILRFRHRLEKHKLADQILATVNDLLAAQGLLLKAGTAVDATLIAAPSSTKNKDKKRDPEMHPSQKGNECHFGMKAVSVWAYHLEFLHQLRTIAVHQS